MFRPTPFDLVFSRLGEERFPRIRAALESAGRDAADRDALLIEREAVLLLHELRPEEGIGEGIDQLAALLHHAYLFWESGLPTIAVTEDALDELLGETPPAPEAGEVPRAFYAEFPERRVWAEVVEGAPPEPLEGVFVHTRDDGSLSVLGVFGLRPERMGFSVVEVAGARPAALARVDGTPLFAPALAGGVAARLHSVTGVEELLELGWRTRAVAGASLTGAG